MISDFLSKNIYRTAFIFCSIFIGLLMTFLSQDYGPLEDTKIHQDHGVRILNYFKGVDELASLSPVDENGKYIDVALSKDNENRGMNGFGGFFDLLTNFLHQYFEDVNVYTFKNLINSVFGFLLFLFCGLIGKEIGNWKTGMLALCFAVLCPVFFGYAMNNPKDIPAAAFYMFSLYHIIKLIKELPKISLKRAFFLIVNISLLINIRVIGLMTIGYLVLAVFLWWFLENYESKFTKIDKKATLVLLGKTIGVSILSYLAVSIFWPYAQTNPLKVPVEILFKMGEFRGFENLQLFEGEWKSSFEMPWYYAIKNLFIIMMPLHAFLGFFLIPLLYFKETKQNILKLSMVLFASVFPMILIIIANPNSHDGSRQFMFLVLPMVILSAASWYKLFSMIPTKNIVRIVFGCMVFLMLQPLKFMIQYHPLQALYFSPIIGGVSGAFGNYEIDYYGVAAKSAVDWLSENVGDKNNPPKVRMYYGSQTKFNYRDEKETGLKYIEDRRHSLDWDYSIVLLAEGKYNKDHLNVNWSKDHTIHEIRIDDVAICFILKNHKDLNRHISELKLELQKKASSNGYGQLAILEYDKGNYFKSIDALNESVRLDPYNFIAFNNLCSTYNQLLMFDEAKIACEKALLIKSDFGLAKNNRSLAIQGIQKRKAKNFTVKEYNFISDNYYKIGYQRKSILAIEELLEKDPNNAVAYNNLCTSYIRLGLYDKAIEACNRAIEIAPDFQMAKNNLKWAEESQKNK
ncbi:tetratricopeptide repeat protein [Aquimarina litoralis]|uniref:tetratricopeptide repeat protein n=1 Tax=Aquimarina litoralis TaxID=584605 RepID=UPI001C561EDC|nr:tetratricopeptide repeat protein [Aquimarina litoralis]MBW1297142.1 tetratricopeptide repeat protein [Aquimarina litoralis]